MTKEELLDILGDVSDRFYAEAMEEAPIEAETVVISKGASKGRIFRIAAATAAAAAAAVGITAAVLNFGTTEDIYKITDANVEYCKEYIAENYGEETEGFAYRILDLNFDERAELLLTAADHTSPLFIFGMAEESMELVSVLGTGADAFLPSLDGLFPYENGEKRYYYYSFSFDNGGDMEARVAAAVKYDESGYYTDNLLSYGILSYEDTSMPSSVFYRIGWDPQDILPAGDYGDIEEEQFRGLWEQYDELPTISFEDFRNKDSTAILTLRSKEICDSYIAEHYSEWVPDTSMLSYYTKDLNFDGKDEIIAVKWKVMIYASYPFAMDAKLYQTSPLFIFEQRDGVPVFNCLIGDDGNGAFIDEGEFANLTPYEKNGEQYYYYYFETYYSEVSTENITSRVAGAIKYDSEKFYTEYLLSYGTVLGGDAGTTEICFFRDDWNVSALSYERDSSTLGYEEFKERWREYSALPPVDFSDISIYTEGNRHSAFEYNDVFYDYTYDLQAFLIDEDRNVTDLDGESRWDTFGSETSAAMLQFASLEYLGDMRQVKLDSMTLEDVDMYRYGDKMLVVWNPPAEQQAEWFDREVEYDTSEFYVAALFEPCKGHKGDYTPFSVSQIPDIRGGAGEHRTFSDKANYSAMYHSFGKSILYREEEAIGGYEFWLVGEQIRTDKKTDPDKIYCSALYALAWKGNDIIAQIPVSAATTPELPIGGDYSDYSVQAFQLRDGLVIFTPTQDVNGYCTPFISLIDDKICCLYGDFSALTEWGSYEMDGLCLDYVKLKEGISFTADPEENTLYYGSFAFKFDFSKVNMPDENGNPEACFTVHELIDEN